MRAVVQRVRAAHVEVAAEVVGRIGPGLLVYLGAGAEDSDQAPEWLAHKLANLRIFEDSSGRLGLCIKDVAGSVLVISQFTLYGDVRRGMRPSFGRAASADRAAELYERLCVCLRARGLTTQTGRFRAEMMVHAEVDGPVTILVDSERVF